MISPLSANARLPRATRCAVAAVAGVTALSLAACGSSNKAAPTSTSTSTVTSTTTSPAPAQGEAKVSGLIASVAGNSIQVTKQDNTNAAVNFTATTKITEVTPGALTDVANGSCVTVRPRGEAQNGQPVVAAAIQVSPAVNGTCPQKKASGSSAPAPSGSPTTPPPPKPAPVRGAVASVTGQTVNVTSTDPNGNTAQTTVTVDDKTKYTKVSSATTEAIAQGKCVMAQGQMDNATLKATSMRVRPAVDGKCGAQPR